jgi:hypothetical protein
MTALSAKLKIFALLGFAVVATVMVAGQQQPLPSEPPRQFGASITGSFEGWFKNDDGSVSFLVGYLNRNRARAVDVPIGPNNRIEPGGPDMGQPTHFLPGRKVGMFIVTVPKDFTPQQRLTWSITVNGETNSIPFRLHTDYNVSPFKIQHDAGTQGNLPALLRLEETGPVLQGPIGMVTRPALTRTTSVSTPLPLNFWAEDDARYSSGSNAPMSNPPPPVEILWSKYRGPGTVTFSKDKPEFEVLAGGKPNQQFRGKGTTTAKFSEPGEYVLHVLASDYSGEGGGGEICCWTTAMVKVTVTP